jgi:hypothetical protein
VEDHGPAAHRAQLLGRAGMVARLADRAAVELGDLVRADHDRVAVEVGDRVRLGEGQAQGEVARRLARSAVSSTPGARTVNGRCRRCSSSLR